MAKGPKILLFDIETAPIIAYVWKTWKEYIGINQIKDDWHLLSFSAKWLNEPASKIIYKDQRNAKNIEDDTKLLKELWNLISSADVIITHNGKKFDLKKINARLVIQGLQPLPDVKHVDTLKLARKHFAFTSNKLDYLSDKLNKKYKKLHHKKFPGFELWKQCLSGNKQAWKEMEKYNKHDVLSLEELYLRLAPWDNTVNSNLYRDNLDIVCECGSKRFNREGYRYTRVGKYQRYRCMECGRWTQERCNELSEQKRKTLRI